MNTKQFLMATTFILGLAINNAAISLPPSTEQKAVIDTLNQIVSNKIESLYYEVQEQLPKLKVQLIFKEKIFENIVNNQIRPLYDIAESELKKMQTIENVSSASYKRIKELLKKIDALKSHVAIAA